MKARSELPDLATLREYCGQPIPSDSDSTIKQEIRPGLWVYAAGQRYMLRPTRWKILGEPLTAEEIAKRINNRPLLQLLAQREEVMQQICIRAAAGDEDAIHMFVSSARGVINALESIEKAQPQKLRAIAETSIDWPVLLSRNPQDIEHARNHVFRLKVGSKAATPRRPGQKIDPRGFWTKLADTGFHACQDNKALVPALEAHCLGTKPERKDRQFFGTKMKANYYYVSPNDCIVITDWEKNCLSLSLPVTEDNRKQWWTAVKHWVLEYWCGYPPGYQEALRQIRNDKEEEWRRRNMAIDRLEQAFRDLFGLRKTSSSTVTA